MVRKEEFDNSKFHLGIKFGVFFKAIEITSNSPDNIISEAGQYEVLTLTLYNKGNYVLGFHDPHYFS